MKNISIKYKRLLYKKNKTRKLTQMGGGKLGEGKLGGKLGGQIGGENENLTSIIQSSNISNFKVIDTKNTIYPKEYVGYNVFISSNNKILTADQLIKDALTEGEFLNPDGKINLYKLDDQVLKDSNRCKLFINKNYMYKNFLEKIKNDDFYSSLTDLTKLDNVELFSTKLKEIFPKLNVNEEELNILYKLSKNYTSEISPNYWAYLSYYDEILNINNIDNDETLNKIKTLSQQNISKTMMDILMQFISIPNIFKNTLHLGGQFKNFGSNPSSYIEQIDSSLIIDMNIPDSNNIVIQNKLYYSLINVDNEFGLAVISTCIYTELSKNQIFIIWKIERWRNISIKNYYDFVISMYNKKTPINEDLLMLMQTNIYNNIINDAYPLTLAQLLDYYMVLIKSKFYTDEEKVSGINYINEIINNNMSKNKTDKEISKIIKTEVNSLLTTKQKFVKTISKMFKPKEQIEDISVNAEPPLQTEEVKPIEEVPIEEGTPPPSVTQEEETQAPSVPQNEEEEEALPPSVPQEEVNPIEETESPSVTQEEASVEEVPAPVEEAPVPSVIEKEKEEEPTTTEETPLVTEDVKQLEQDQQNINETENKLNELRQQLDNDQLQLRQDEPPLTETEQKINNLAMTGTLGALGAVGAGLYFAAPLLVLGGSNKQKIKKTIKRRSKPRDKKKTKHKKTTKNKKVIKHKNKWFLY